MTTHTRLQHPKLISIPYIHPIGQNIAIEIGYLISTGCPTKNYTLFWRAVVSLNFELGIKVRGVLESSGSQLFKTVPTFDF